jgi:glucose-induced degradation protein 4
VSQSAPSEEGTQPMNSTKGEGRQRTRRDSSVRRREASPTPLSAPVATMSGFYYHQNSEP